MIDRWNEYAESLERDDAELLRQAAIARMAMPVRSCDDCEGACECVQSDPAARPEWQR